MTPSSKRQVPPDTGNINSLLRLQVKRRCFAMLLMRGQRKTRPPKRGAAITARTTPDCEPVRKKERKSGIAVKSADKFQVIAYPGNA